MNRAVHVALHRLNEQDEGRLLLNVPYGYHNRSMIGLARTTWLLGHHSHQQHLLLCPPEDLWFRLNNTTMTCLEIIMSSSWYRRLFPRANIYRSGPNAFETAADGRLVVSHLKGPLPAFQIDHLTAIDIEQGCLVEDCEAHQTFDWVASQALAKLKTNTPTTAVTLNQRTGYFDLHARIASGNLGAWNRLTISYFGNEGDSYPVSVNNSQALHVREEDDALPPDPEEILPGINLPIQMMMQEILYGGEDVVALCR